MEALKILADDSSPAVLLDASKGMFHIRGNSMPENARAFYEPIINWFEKYAENPNIVTEIVFQMNMLNTSSTKIFIDIFKRINKIVDHESNEVNVIWYYNYGDDDIQEVGVEFKAFCKASFELVAVNDGE
ncbi:MAG: hypothetical protein C0597_03340 [Marinilabiliales bacterium]|nr:MAG: hypothetical protein C0597_03340 [Marinilabiliales bacterium]